MAFDSIRGKVAQVINDREVVLNKGFEDGVREGMYFNILDEEPHAIPDPDTGETLGELQQVKIVVRARAVGKRITLATTFRTKTVNIGGVGPERPFTTVFTAPKYVKEIERLRYDEESGLPAVSNTTVSTGDIFESTDQESAELSGSAAVLE